MTVCLEKLDTLGLVKLCEVKIEYTTGELLIISLITSGGFFTAYINFA